MDGASAYDHADELPAHTQRPPRASPAPIPPAEAALVRRVQADVGGPAALCALAGPAAVRAAVIVALSEAQPNAKEQARVAAGELTPAERRVVRTVTNRGAAVRSRLRQRKELARLRAELRAKDERVRVLEAALRDAFAAGLYPPPGSAAAGAAGASTAPPFMAPAPTPALPPTPMTPQRQPKIEAQLHTASPQHPISSNLTSSPVSEASHPPMGPPPSASLPMPSYYHSAPDHNLHALHHTPTPPHAELQAQAQDDLGILEHLISPC